MGIVSALRLSPNEVVMTRALGVLINQSQVFAQTFLADFFGARFPKSAVAQCEVAAGEAGRIDLVVEWIDEGEKHCAVIEHKLKAGEGEDQTARYRSVAATLWASRSGASPAALHSHPHLLFLALFPWEIAKDEAFISRSHRELIPSLERAATDGDPVISAIAREWADELKHFYGSIDRLAAVSWKEAIGQETPGGLPAGHLVAQLIRDRLDPKLATAGLHVNNIYRSAGLGHSWIGVVVERNDKAWQTPLRIRSNDGPDAYLHYQVHLPVDGSGDVMVRVSLELLPYRPQRLAREILSDLFIDAYRAQRSAFIDRVRAPLKAHKWKVTDKWNYLATKRIAAGVQSVETLAGAVFDPISAELSTLDAAWKESQFGLP